MYDPKVDPTSNLIPRSLRYDLVVFTSSGTNHSTSDLQLHCRSFSWQEGAERCQTSARVEVRAYLILLSAPTRSLPVSDGNRTAEPKCLHQIWRFAERSVLVNRDTVVDLVSSPDVFTFSS